MRILFLILPILLGKTPKIVVDFIRHGARGAAAPSPFFPNITWESYGELTNAGQRMHTLLGALRRQQYINSLIPSEFDPSVIYVRSTAVNRCLSSAQSYILGLFPTGLQSLNKNQTKHQYDLLAPPLDLSIGKSVIELLKDHSAPFDLPIFPVQAVDITTEELLLIGNCPFADVMLERYWDSDMFKRLRDKEFLPLWQKIMEAYPEITLKYIQKGINSFLLADFLIASCADARCPMRISENIIEECQRFMASVLRDAHIIDPLVARIGMNGISKAVLNHFRSSIENSSPVRYVLYSAHDATLVMILEGMKFFNSSIKYETVPFASNLLFELDKEDKNEDYTVSAFYNGELIHSESYENFVEHFTQAGHLNNTRKELCRIS